MSRATFVGCVAFVMSSLYAAKSEGAFPRIRGDDVELRRESAPGMRADFGAARERGGALLDPSRFGEIAIGYIEWSGAANVAERGGVAYAFDEDAASVLYDGMLAGLVSLVDIRLGGGVSVFMGMNETSPLDRRSALFAYDPMVGEVQRLSPRNEVTLPARSISFGIEVPVGVDEQARLGLEFYYAADDRNQTERSWAVGLTWRMVKW